jgi:ADP-heptose:LPS heptosyltransferase
MSTDDDPQVVTPDLLSADIPDTFPYTVDLDANDLIPVEAAGALIAVSFRHFHKTSIFFGRGGAAGTLNVGFRLYPEAEDVPCFEDRASLKSATIQPSERLVATIRIPRDRVEFGLRYRLFVDLVREQQFWFCNRGAFGFTFLVEFRDAEQANRQGMQAMQIPMLEDNLIKAFSRIAELEHSERGLLAERDEYRNRLAALNERMGRDFDSIAALPPAATRVSNILRSNDPVQRRDLWLNAIASVGIQGAMFALYPHDGRPGPLRILVHGSGGFGDMIYLGAIVRELQEHFANSEIVVVHENQNVEAVFATNPRVSVALPLKSENLTKFLLAANRLDIFDLVAEVRYAVTYSTPPLSRVPMAFQIRSNIAGAEWQKFVRYDWPHLNHIFANTVTAKGLGKLDLVGLTSMLPITRYSDLDLFVPLSQMAAFPVLAGAPYVTVHHGADRNMASSHGLQTKNMTTAKWSEVVEIVKAEGFQVVQLGDAHEDLIVGVDLDLRGKTSFLQSAYVIKTARAHLDTEGGLVHVARAVNTRSVVMFGPTPASFFGYPQNENISPKLCGNCWWVTRRWAAECPRGLVMPECMESHNPTDVASRVVKIARPDSRLLAEVVEPFVDVPTMTEVLQKVDLPFGEGLVLLGPGVDVFEVAEFLSTHLPLATLLVETDNFRASLASLHSAIRIKPYSDGNIPLRSERFPWAIGLGLDLRNEKGIALALDLQRCVAGNGSCYLLGTNKGQPLPIGEWLEHMVGAATRHQGGGFSLKSPAQLDAGKRKARKVVALLLCLAHASDAVELLVPEGLDSAPETAVVIDHAS